MKISITYCTRWNYLPRASSLAAEIEAEFATHAELIPGGNGIYDVVVDEELIFSKDRVGRFPSEGEICQAIRERA